MATFVAASYVHSPYPASVVVVVTVVATGTGGTVVVGATGVVGGTVATGRTATRLATLNLYRDPLELTTSQRPVIIQIRGSVNPVVDGSEYPINDSGSFGKWTPRCTELLDCVNEVVIECDVGKHSPPITRATNIIVTVIALARMRIWDLPSVGP